MTLVPCYGRDFKSVKEVKAALAADLDFTIADISSPWNGSYVKRSQLVGAGKTTVNVRYKQLRSVCVVDLTKIGQP